MLFLRGEHNPILIILPSILEESKAILSIRSKAISVQSHDTADYVQCKGEKEKYTHLNAEFQRIARRDKKAFLSNQCKEIEESNSMGKTKDLFKKIRDTKGTFHAKMGSIKDGNGMDLTENRRY